MAIKVAVVSPSGTYTEEELERAHIRARELDVEIVHLSEARKTDLIFLHGSLEQRLYELKNAEYAFADAIWCARGGVGAVELWPHYLAHIFEHSHAPLIGYSDITIYHFMRLMRARRIGIHGPVFLDLAKDNAINLKTLTALVHKKAEEIIYPHLISLNDYQQEITGQLVPMNLASLQSIIGCFDPNFFRGKILAIEDINESPYKVFRMMQQLNNVGMLAVLSALIIGHFNDERSTIIEKVMLPLAHQLKIPLFDWPIFGHDQPNWPLLFGATATLKKIDNRFFALLYNEQHDHRPILL